MSPDGHGSAHGGEHEERFVRCARCGGRIGIYEPLWWQMPDGSVVPSAYLPMTSHPEFWDAESRHFHEACLSPRE